MHTETSNGQLLSLTVDSMVEGCIFLCLRYKVAGGIMFSGCPSVRTYVRTSRSRDRVISRTDWLIPAKLGSCMYLTEPMN